jgi:metal-dependent amidase/aminoacylase/carboxypeptidase family protein
VGREIGEDCLTRVEPVTGSEDFPYLTAHVPGMYVFLGVGNEAKGAAYPHHHPQFTLDEDALELGTRLHAGFARAFLSG